MPLAMVPLLNFGRQTHGDWHAKGQAELMGAQQGSEQGPSTRARKHGPGGLGKEAGTDAGADGATIVGVLGESNRMTDVEREVLIRAAVEVAMEAVQVHGGNGYMSEYRVEQLARDAKVLQIYAGTDEIQIRAIARELLSQ